MQKLILNLAPRPRLDFRRILPLFFILALLAGVFTFLGLGNFSRHAAKTQQLTAAIASLSEKAADFSEQSKKLQSEILDIQTRWNTRVALANALILKKSHSFLTLLNYLEKLIPEGVMVTNLSLGDRIPARISLQVQTLGFEKLMELYRNLSQLGLTTSRESEKDGLFTAAVEFDVKL